VGYLFQNYALFPRMTVLENIITGLPLPKQEAKAKARVWLNRLQLGEFEDRYPSRLSGGQQQRAALIRMLIREPEAVLLDEPFSALDTNLREQMQFQLLELLKTRGDVIMVTHSRDEAYRICSEILVMDEGRVLGKGETRELFRNPGLVRIARLTGCKNISPIRQTGEREILALDWGLPLTLDYPLPPGISHVGIRAHDFLLQGGSSPEKPLNGIRPAILQRSEEPFEHAVLFTNADAKVPEERGIIWWKYSKYAGTHTHSDVPERLFVPSASLLLLR
jgi:molybdate transport system ATP-binding protein